MATAASYGRLPFEEQIAYIRRKLTDVDYTSVIREAHDHAFVIAGMHRTDMVADVHTALTDAIVNGLPRETFRVQFQEILDGYGYEIHGGVERRARIIYETNLRTSYAAGRYQQLQSVKASRPYWMYRHSDAVLVPRELHLSWDGMVLHADDPWWLIYYPPNGYGCDCTVTAHNLRDLRRMGKDGPDPSPEIRYYETEYKGEMVTIPVGTDPGWAYAPGRSVFESQVQLAIEKTTKLPPQAAAPMVQQMLSNSGVSDALNNSWNTWLDNIQRTRGFQGHRINVGTLSPRVVSQLQERAIQPVTSAISISDRDVQHILRASKTASQTATGLPKAINLDELRQLPQMLARPQAILLEPSAKSLLYVAVAERRDAERVVVMVNYRLQGERVTNSVRTATLISWADVKKDLNSGKLELLEGSI